MSHTLGTCDIVGVSKLLLDLFAFSIVCGPLLECLFDSREWLGTAAFRTRHPTDCLFALLHLFLHIARISFVRLFLRVELCDDKGHF